MAGTIAARYLAPKNVTGIGIVGAGTQARFQLSYLRNIISCRNVLVWGMNAGKLNIYKSDMENEGFSVKTTLDIQQIIRHCNLIVCTTPSRVPLLKFNKHLKGTHITAIGSDTREKQELDPLILKNADLVIADSIKQCMERGEIFKAIKAGMISKDVPIELGQIISGNEKGRSSEDQITVADFTGLAVQDIIIAVAVFKAMGS
jgi:ornithine cyclodeaminase